MDRGTSGRPLTDTAEVVSGDDGAVTGGVAAVRAEMIAPTDARETKGPGFAGTAMPTISLGAVAT